MPTLICIPLRKEFSCYDVTTTNFKIDQFPVDISIGTRFTLDGQPIKITKQTIGKNDVSIFEYHPI